MNTISRRQREFEQRELLFLETASEIIRSEGVSALTMDKIAELTEYAKGTVYKHFCSKEDILCGLCVERLSKGIEMFGHAIQIEGHSRRKIVAVGVAYQLFTNQYPEEFDLLIAARTNNIQEKASPERIEQLENIDCACQQVIDALIEQAVNDGDLTLPHNMQTNELGFGLWASCFGLLALSQAQGLVSSFRPDNVNHFLVSHMNCLLDGYGWHPLSHNNKNDDYSAALQHFDALM